MTGVIHISLGGPMRKISVKGKIIEFEMHPYCGPNILNRKGEPLKNQPMAFLEAASLWTQQGQKIGADGLCEWHHESEPILKRISSRTAIVTGYTPARKGS